MDSIKDIIPQVIEKITRQRMGVYEALERVGQNIFGKQELKHIKLVGTQAGKVTIIVDSPAFLHYLRTRKMKILKQLHQELPDIHDITIQVGRI